MREETVQNVQGQTAQPSPGTQSPQGTGSDNIQGALDSEGLEGAATSNIQVPSADGTFVEATPQTVSQEENQSDNGLPAFDVGTGLLIGIFILAITLLLFLARFAKTHTEKTESEPEKIPQEHQTDNTNATSEKPQPIPKGKKQTRRERGKNKKR